MSRQNKKAIIAHLGKDTVMKRLAIRHPFPQWNNKRPNLFSDLVECIVCQQLADKAGATIFARFKKLFGGGLFPRPAKILKTHHRKIRSCGISYAKVRSIKGLCRAVIKDELDLKGLPKLSDEQVVQELTKLKGIGRWSAEMILIFSLKRPDVFSAGDLGLCTAVSRLYKVERDDQGRIEKIAERFRPYRSYACWYLWKSLSKK